MYQGFYGFRERPFTLLPDPDFLFLDEKHRTALEMLETAVSARSGFCVISGEIGAGKTTLIRELLNRLDENVCVGLISNTHPSFGELLQWIMAAYGLPCGSGEDLEMHKRFVEFSIQQYAQNKRTLLIIDEAQNLTMQALEELRMLSSVNSGKDLVLQVILVGQQQLRDRLQQPELEQFSQRIALRYHLQALDSDETYRYIQHRVDYAGGEAGLFSADACQAIYKLSGGIPRLINRLCDLSLVYGCTTKSKVITDELVERVGEDQRMGTLRDIPRAEPSVEVSAPEETGEAGRPSSETIVGAVSPALMPDLDTAVSHKETATETTEPSELHQLVVDAENKKRSGGERGALWLLLGVVALVGGAGWLMSDFQKTDLVAESGDSKTQVASPAANLPPATEEDLSAAPVISVEDQAAQPEAGSPEHQDDRQLSVADSSDPVKKETEKDSEAEEVAAQNAAKVEKAEKAAQQRAAELKREAEEITRLKKESDRMERERRTVEKRLAKQRAARKELERKAHLEQEKMTAARKAAKKLAEERTRAEKRPAEAAASKSERPKQPVRTGKAVASFPVSVVDAYDEDDGDDIVLDAKASLANDTAEAGAETDSADGVVGLLVTSPTDEDGDSIIDQDEKGESVEFAANPCDGQTARFLSTCR